MWLLACSCLVCSFPPLRKLTWPLFIPCCAAPGAIRVLPLKYYNAHFQVVARVLILLGDHYSSNHPPRLLALCLRRFVAPYSKQILPQNRALNFPSPATISYHSPLSPPRHSHQLTTTTNHVPPPLVGPPRRPRLPHRPARPRVRPFPPSLFL